MARYRSRPKTVHAAQWDGTPEARFEIAAFAGGRVHFAHAPGRTSRLFLDAGVAGASGRVEVPLHDWVVADHETDDFWPVDFRRFEDVYDHVGERPDLPA
jgi:hypothetical protein